MEKRLSLNLPWQIVPYLGLLLLGCLLAGCAAGISSPTPTPPSDCLTPVPDAEIEALYPSQDDLWPIEDCHEAYAAARLMTSVGHMRLTEVTHIISVEQIAAREVPSLQQFGRDPAWRVELRGRLAFDPPPNPPDAPSPTNTSAGPVYGCMQAIFLASSPNYGSVGSSECPAPPDLLSPTP